MIDFNVPSSGGGGAHATDHERGGSDEIDGDHLDIDFTPTNYTPATTPAEAANVDDLAAHLYGLDQVLANATSWDTAFSWGDHSGQGYITASSNDTLTNKTIDASQLEVTNNFDYGEYNVYANLFGATLDSTTYADLSSTEWEFYVGGSAVLHLDSVQDATFYGNIAGPTTQVSSHHILDLIASAPSAPGGGTSHLYAKTDGELYFYADGGSETQVTNQTGGGGGGSGVSPQPIQLDSGAWYAPVTNGAAPGFVELATNDVALPTFDFDDTTQEYAQCRLKVPADWDGNDITVKIEWTVATTPSGTGTDAVKWNLQTLPLANDEQMDAAWSTADTVTDTANTTAGANKIYETAAFTVAAADVGTAGEMLFLRLSRHAGDAADEIVGDVKFISATFFFDYA